MYYKLIFEGNSNEYKERPATVYGFSVTEKVSKKLFSLYREDFLVLRKVDEDIVKQFILADVHDHDYCEYIIDDTKTSYCGDSFKEVVARDGF